MQMRKYRNGERLTAEIEFFEVRSNEYGFEELHPRRLLYDRYELRRGPETLGSLIIVNETPKSNV